MKRPDVSIIIPAYNEERLIDATLTKVARFIKSNKAFLGSCEVIVGATGTDSTAVKARAHAHEFDHLVVFERKNAGKGGDVKAAFGYAQGDIQLFFDADLSTPLANVIEMVRQLRSGADVAIGVRLLTKIHPGFFRSVMSLGANLLTRGLLPTIKDTQCGFKGFTHGAAQKLFAQQKVNGWGFDVELLVHARQNKFRVVQLLVKDWFEAGDVHLVGQSPVKVAIRTLREVGAIYATVLGDWLVRRSGFIAALSVGVVVLVAAWIGLDRSLWFDEAYTAALIKQPVDQLIHFTSVDVHPPLYYVLLQAWAGLFGNTDVALRSFSLLCGALASGVALITVRRMFGPKIMLATVPFVVLAPFLLRYSIEARMYALASLIGVSATYVLVCALQQQKQHAYRIALWFAYGLLVLAGMYTLFYTALIWLVHLGWCIYKQGRPRTLWTLIKKPWIAAYAGAALFFIPWLLISFDALRSSGLWVGPPSYKEVVNVFSLALTWTTEWQLGPWGSLVIMSTIVLTVALLVRAWRRASAVQRSYLVLLILYAFLPIMLLFVASLPPSKPAFLYRYFAHTLLGAYALLGVIVGLTWRKSAFAKIAGVFILGVLALGVTNLYQAGNYNLDSLRQPSAKEVAAFLQSQNTAGTIFVADTSELYFEMVQYVNSPQLYFYDGNKSVQQRGGSAMLLGSLKQIQSSLQAQQPIYCIYYGETPKLQFSADSTARQVFARDAYKVVLVTPGAAR